MTAYLSLKTTCKVVHPLVLAFVTNATLRFQLINQILSQQNYGVLQNSIAIDGGVKLIFNLYFKIERSSNLF